MLKTFADGLRVTGRTAYLAHSGGASTVDMATQTMVLRACVMAGKVRKRRTTIFPIFIFIFLPHSRLYVGASRFTCVLFYTNIHTPKAVTYNASTVMIGHTTVGSL